MDTIKTILCEIAMILLKIVVFFILLFLIAIDFVARIAQVKRKG